VSKRIAFLLLALVSVQAFGRDKQESWIQVTSPHFVVFCEGNEKQARHTANEFERMRLVFQTAFPKMHVDPSSPIVVIALKNAKDFRALEPEAYLAKGQIELAGLFLRAPDKNYVLLRMDAGGEHPYATVYHEYTHLLLSKVGDWFPLWLNEGLAEFYQNTDIHDKETILGQASADDILWLRQNRILPLSTLLTVDDKSPYYHEEHKGSIFYAESWALTHFIEVQDARNNTQKLQDYVVMVGNHVDSLTAATRVFGDLKQLQSALEKYIEQSTFYQFKLNGAVTVDDSTFKLNPVPITQVDAVRADFLAYNQREKDARVLLDQVLHDDPTNVLAHETLGYLEFRAGHLEEAQNYYQQAVKLDSQSFLANYYFALIAMRRGEQSDPEMDKQIESSLQHAIKLNPSFAPSYEGLALFYGMSGSNLPEAQRLITQAVQLDPSNLHFRTNAANILMRMQREDEAIRVLQVALKMAKTPDEVSEVATDLQMAQQAQQARKHNEEQARLFHDRMAAADASSDQTETVAAAAVSTSEEPVLKGPRHSVTGTIKNVHCSPPAIMDLQVESSNGAISMHSGNYYKITFTALGFTPQGDLNPCSDLEGAHAKVEYSSSTDSKINGLLTIEMHK